MTPLGRFTNMEPSLFDDLLVAQTISVESSENYALILHLDNKTYYFNHGDGEMDGTSIDYGPGGAAAGEWNADG